MTDASVVATDEPTRLSLSEKAYQILVKKITRLELAPGTVLAEKALMANLGIGRTPIREALQRLAIEGLASHQPNRGMFVSDVSATSVQYIYEFRALIEGFTARLAAIRSSEEDILELDRLQTQLAAATEENNIDHYVALDHRFHEALARASGNSYLEEVVPRIFNLHLRLWFFISKKTGGWHSTAHSHEEMTKAVVDAVRHRQPEEAEQAMATYISRRHREIKELL
ncbi:MAG: GntR family transcriptional regulator [Acidiferrobacterales bacterium]